MIRKFISLITLQFFIFSLNAQSCYNNYTGDVLNANYIEENVYTKSVVPYTHLTERAALWDIIKCAVLKEGSLTIYELGVDFDDQFRFPVQPKNGNRDGSEFKKRLLLSREINNHI